MPDNAELKDFPGPSGAYASSASSCVDAHSSSEPSPALLSSPSISLPSTFSSYSSESSLSSASPLSLSSSSESSAMAP
ncbi:hypothetical protein FIBSPDRAFT_276613 [Athelia psychrophila]|uniref:Uncharacterized protein n=1 Tax=Athelia psychrophila TaxID=1759441 RepID=A0A165WQU8_9AGAM|nr:hypothetical protein FIBSPDRAFT_276613 [Fibularhizoctonia sp. CBS 109695]